MIWGRTTKQYLKKKFSLHEWFAWRPVMLRDGRYAWLHIVNRQRRLTQEGYDHTVLTDYTPLTKEMT